MHTSEQTFLILSALADTPLHGYGIIKDVTRQTAGETVLAAGTLYGALERLAREGWIEEDRIERDGKRVRRIYRLTTNGRDALLEELTRRERSVSVARKRVSLWPEAETA